MTSEVTQAARDAVADLMTNPTMSFWYGVDVREDIQRGRCDNNAFVQAFAKFERETIARLTAQSGDCDLCQGSGVNRSDQLWPDHPPACRACNGSGTAQSGEGRRGAGEDAVTVGLAEQVAEAMEDDGGEWRSCTGCHETNEGYSTGHFAYSAALKCELGSGCRECGGIGAVWDDTDYADMADFMAAADRDHANIKRILIENDIQPYRAEQIAMAITELEIPAALNARQSGEGEREDELARVVHANGPVVVDWMGECLAWRPLDYGTWSPLAALRATDEGSK